VRRLGRDSYGDGSPDTGFSIVPAVPPTNVNRLTDASLANIFDTIFGPLRFFLRFPGDLVEGFDQGGFTLSSAQGNLRTATDRPHQGTGFLRLSGHAGTVTVRRTLSGTIDLSASDVATLWYRRNRKTDRALKFFVEDSTNGRSVWPVISNPAFPPDSWLPAVVTPLDVRYRILNQTLRNGVVGDFYDLTLAVCGGTPPFTWSATGTLPPGMALPSGPVEKRSATTGSMLTQAGTFTFTLRVTDGANRTATQQLTIVVQPTGPAHGLTTPARVAFQSAMPFETPTGTPADLTRVHAYGFEVPQDPGAPLVWDFDDLRVGSDARHRAVAGNNFVIRGPLSATRVVDAALESFFGQLNGAPPDDPTTLAIVDQLIGAGAPDTPDPATAARLHVSGLTCLQLADTLYSQQADPNDPPLVPPPPGQTRKDTVYADVWTEPVTYVDDPDIREVALGGPDTTTRSRVRHRVRVAQGAGLPSGDGRGAGTLATQGSYTAQVNRLYLVEIDTPGDLGTATFRWSDENAATIQRVIAPLPSGSTAVTVEDAAAFAPGDRILIRKEFGAEEHQIVSVVGNVIGLAHATGGQLATLPAAGRVDGFTTFALADRPTVQRWNAFRVPIGADSADPTVSPAVPLNDGVSVRFGGHGMRAGDYWNFRTRFLAGDEATGLDPVTRIEQVNFQRPRGVVHHYAALATLTRGPADAVPELISDIADLRRRAGTATTVHLRLGSAKFKGTARALLGGSRLPAVSPDSKLVVFWSGDVVVPAAAGGLLSINVAFYNDQMTDPVAHPDTGRVSNQTRTIDLSGRPVGALPFQFLFADVNTIFQVLGGPAVPTSVQVIGSLTDGVGGDIVVRDMHANVLELKKSTELINDIDD
jgi:hypothetical protein